MVWKLLVSIHAPVKVRLNQIVPDNDYFVVSIHAPVKVRLFFDKDDFILEGFNPRTREGATKALFNFAISFIVSIHAPVKVRLLPDNIRRFQKSFNPRTREGATFAQLKWAIARLFQSTHP